MPEWSNVRPQKSDFRVRVGSPTNTTTTTTTTIRYLLDILYINYNNLINLYIHRRLEKLARNYPYSH